MLIDLMGFGLMTLEGSRSSSPSRFEVGVLVCIHAWLVADAPSNTEQC